MEYRKQWEIVPREERKYIKLYDREKITITKYGKTYNLYDSIQAAREDTEIYPTLEKYGNLKTMETTASGIYADLTEINNLQDLLMQDRKLEELFDSLPSKERNLFDNDFYKFKQNAPNYYMEKAKEEIKQNKQPEKQTEKQQENKDGGNK